MTPERITELAVLAVAGPSDVYVEFFRSTVDDAGPFHEYWPSTPHRTTTMSGP